MTKMSGGASVFVDRISTSEVTFEMVHMILVLVNKLATGYLLYNPK